MNRVFDMASPEPETAPPAAAGLFPDGRKTANALRRPHVRRPTRAGWAMAWAVGFAALAAAGLIATGSWTVFLGLLLAAFPGVVSAVWRPLGLARIVVLTGWALLSTAAALRFGGSAGPVLLVALGPGLAGVVLGAWRPGALLAGLALLATWLLTAIGGAAYPPIGGFGMFLAVAVTAVVGASAVYATQVVRRG